MTQCKKRLQAYHKIFWKIIPASTIWSPEQPLNFFFLVYSEFLFDFQISKEVCSLPASDQTALFAPTNDFLQEAMNDTSTAQAFMNFFFIVSSPSLRPAVKNTVKSLTDLFSAYGNDRPERNASLCEYHRTLIFPNFASRKPNLTDF